MARLTKVLLALALIALVVYNLTHGDNPVLNWDN
jgi:hypothetical protein